MAPHRAFHGATRAQSKGGPVQRWPSPRVAPVQLHRKARCYTHPMGLSIIMRGGALGPQGCQARSHFRATRAFGAPYMPRHHGCPGPTDAHRPPLGASPVEFTPPQLLIVLCFTHTHPKDPNGSNCPPSDFTTAYSPSLRPPQQSQQSASHIVSPAQHSTCSLRALSLHRSPLPPPFSSPPTSLPCREILAVSSNSGNFPG
jgi:hypothetical protein